MYQILPMNTLNAVMALSISLICIISFSQFWIESKSSTAKQSKMKKKYF